MILVTGGTGLVGAHLLLHLIESRNVGNEYVRALYRNSKNIEKTKLLFKIYGKENLLDKIEWCKGDITDIPSLENAFQGIEYVYHCAGLISFDPKDEELLRKTNIEGTANIVNFCLAYNIKKLCHLSSVAALGKLTKNKNTITEETEWNPEKQHSDYAISKYGAEMEVWRGQQEGLATYILNPGIILGPGFKENGSGLLFSKTIIGLPFYTLGSTGFIAVTDVVLIAEQIMKSTISNERYILVAQNLIIRDILNSISDALHLNRPRIEVKPWQLEIAWRLDWIFSIFSGRKKELTKYSARAAYSKNKFSNEKIKADFEIDFLNINNYITEIVSLQTNF